MVSIRRFLDQRRHDADAESQIVEASTQMCRLLLDAVTTHAIRGREADWRSFNQTILELLGKLDETPSAFDILETSSEAAEAIEAYSLRTSEYFREQNEQMQAMVSMLTETLADISGQADASTARLKSIEQQIEQATGLDDIRALRASLKTCLVDVREAAAQQKKDYTSTVDRLKDNINVAQARLAEALTPPAPSRLDIDRVLESRETDEPSDVLTIPYVAAFKLQRADHIAARFGVGARNELLALVGQALKGVLGPNDRMLRWKGTSFVMFLNSTGSLAEIRMLLTEAVARMGQHYIEVGNKAALISVGVDWIVFPQSQCCSLDSVFTEVDSFLAGNSAASSSHAQLKGIGQ